MNQQNRALVIVDYQNVRGQADELRIPPARLFQALWDKVQSLGDRISEVRLFVPILQSSDPWNDINALALRYGFSVEACPFLREGKIRKDVVDFVIFRWLTRHASLADTFVFVTGDGDFIVAATMLKLQRKEVEVWTFAADQTSETLFTAARASVLPLKQETQREDRVNRYAAAVDKLLNGEEMLPPEIALVDQVVYGGQFLETQRGEREEEDTAEMLAAELGIGNTDAQNLLNTVEGLGIRQSPEALQTLKAALQLRKERTSRTDH